MITTDPLLQQDNSEDYDSRVSPTRRFSSDFKEGVAADYPEIPDEAMRNYNLPMSLDMNVELRASLQYSPKPDSRPDGTRPGAGRKLQRHGRPEYRGYRANPG
jgi:hypothetical protein